MAPAPANRDETDGPKRVDEICDDFERQWASGEPPRLESFLAEDVDGDALFYELLVIELEHRLRLGERPTRDEYVRRFPGRDDPVRRAFVVAGDLQMLLELGSKRKTGSTIVLSEDKDATPASQPTIQRLPTVDGEPAPKYVTDHELLEEVGRGGMGVVFKARQRRLNRIVALKMILSGEWASEEERRRFQQEAQAAAALDHPHIVPVYEVGEHDGRLYFTMRYCAGKSLSKLAAEGPFAPRCAAELVAQAADAVGYAHGEGIIHRDLKPANVLVDEGDHLWITDFGLAKRTQDDSNLTATRQVLGTPGYMSPEQASGQTREIGPAADIYSLGAILYRLLTGRPPFQAATADETLQQVKNAEPAAPRELNPSCAARPGNDLPEVFAKGRSPALCVGRRVGRRPAAVLARRTRPGAARDARGAAGSLGAAKSGFGLAGGRRLPAVGHGHRQLAGRGVLFRRRAPQRGGFARAGRSCGKPRA